MSIDLTKIHSASFLPGFQTIGTTDTIATVSGTIPPKGNLIGSFLLNFPTADVVSVNRVTFPDGQGDLASFWFPVQGGIEVFDVIDGTHSYIILMYVQSSPAGRSVSYDFVNATGNSITLTNFRIHFYSHLYTYPW